MLHDQGGGPAHQASGDLEGNGECWHRLPHRLEFPPGPRGVLRGEVPQRSGHVSHGLRTFEGRADVADEGAHAHSSERVHAVDGHVVAIHLRAAARDLERLHDLRHLRGRARGVSVGAHQLHPAAQVHDRAGWRKPLGEAGHRLAHLAVHQPLNR